VPVTPAEAKWIIQHCVTDPTSGSLQADPGFARIIKNRNNCEPHNIKGNPNANP